MDALRRVARDHARARRLLRPVVEDELDVRVRVQVETERVARLAAGLRRTVAGVRLLQRREPSHVRRVVAGRKLLAVVAEQLREPPRAQRVVTPGRLVAGALQRAGELAERDRLLLLVPLDRI